MDGRRVPGGGSHAGYPRDLVVVVERVAGRSGRGGRRVRHGGRRGRGGAATQQPCLDNITRVVISWGHWGHGNSAPVSV